MTGGESTTLGHYKKILTLFIIITVTCLYILLPYGQNVSASLKNRFLHNSSSHNSKPSASTVAVTPNIQWQTTEVVPVDKRGRYVSMCSGNFDNRRLGNQLFNFAAMTQVAHLTGRRGVAMVKNHPHGWLDRWFQVPITRIDEIDKELCPCTIVGEERGLAYSSQMSKLSSRTDIANKSLLICGWFQSWKYTIGVESELRRLLRPLANVSTAVYSFLEQSRQSSWKGLSYSTVAIHVRAGDCLRKDKFNFGYTIPQRPYFYQAMGRFRQELGGHIQFVVMSDSLSWTKEAINFSSIAEELNQNQTSAEGNVSVAYSEGHDAGFDMVLMSLCDGVIFTTGTYGWWGAYLANKTTTYYSVWPRPGSPLSRLINRKDFFPPNWIPIGGPFFPCCQSDT